MAQQEETNSIYVIPENYIDSGYILNGEFRTRYFVEAVIVAVIFLVVAILLTKNVSRNPRIVICTFVTAVPFFACLKGINGDPVSVFIKSSVHWLRHKKLRRFNETPMPLSESPLDSELETETARDKVYNMMESSRERKEARLKKEKQTQYDFKIDADIANHLYDPEEDETNDNYFITYVDEDDEELTLNESEDADFRITLDDDDDELEAMRKELLDE